MDQNLSQYRIFYAVAIAGNISRAAKELYISQPAISKSISKLEDSLHTSLFTRNSRGVQLTEEGQVLFEHTRAAFEQLSIGEQELKRIREFNSRPYPYWCRQYPLPIYYGQLPPRALSNNIPISKSPSKTSPPPILFPSWSSRELIWGWWRNQSLRKTLYLSRLPD